MCFSNRTLLSQHEHLPQSQRHASSFHVMGLALAASITNCSRVHHMLVAGILACNHTQYGHTPNLKLDCKRSNQCVDKQSLRECMTGPRLDKRLPADKPSNHARSCKCVAGIYLGKGRYGGRNTSTADAMQALHRLTKQL